MGNLCSCCYGNGGDRGYTPIADDAVKLIPVVQETEKTPSVSPAKTSTASSPASDPVIIPSAAIVRGSIYSQGSFAQNYDLKEIVGQGSTSSCHRCVRKKDASQFACKVIDKRQVEVNFSGLLEQFNVEIKVLSELKHPNIIHLEDVYETPDRIFMVMEIMTGGELFDYVVEKGTLSEEEASCFIRQITSAICYMHSQGVIHRDLKPENLLLKSKQPNGTVKIIDFGLAKVLAEKGDDRTQSFLGTRGYLAPEMLQRNSYDKSIDIWALGVITFVLLCGCLPFDDDSSKLSSESAARAKFVLRFPRWANNLSNSAKDLLEKLLTVEPKFRITAKRAEQHPWVTGKGVLPNNYLASPGRMGAVRQELREPVSPTMKAMHDRIEGARPAPIPEGNNEYGAGKGEARPRKKSF